MILKKYLTVKCVILEKKYKKLSNKSNTGFFQNIEIISCT